MAKILIAGAGGYVGRNLVAALDGEVEVTGIDIAPGYIKPEDVKTLEGLYDVFYNFAWVGKGGPQRADYNLQMTNVKNALDFYKEAVRLGCKRYICAGTIGELMVELPECAKIRSQNFIYIQAKNFLHRVLNSIEEPDKCRVIWARLGNLYGGGDSGGNLVDYTLKKLAANEKAIFGPAEQPYDFVHALDAAHALAAIGIAERIVSSEFYIGSGDVRLLKDYLLSIGKIMGKPNLIEIGGRPDDGTRYRAEWFSIASLMKETKYRPTIPFESGVRAL
ncbi:MAG: NAD(P)-dependent oxidoreductase [Kiritimatiellae bacterium]|nr:NAD(P)-dependent oxidoreductase [Kiritimatiellia bacterium]